LKDINDHLKSYSDLKGEKITVIDFWATWCSPCIKAIPELNKIFETYRDFGVAFIGLNVDSPRNNSKIKSFVNAQRIEYTVLKDPNGSIQSMLSISNVPTLLIVNSEDRIIFRHQGYRSGDEKLIEEEIKKILAEDANE